MSSDGSSGKSGPDSKAPVSAGSTASKGGANAGIRPGKAPPRPIAGKPVLKTRPGPPLPAGSTAEPPGKQVTGAGAPPPPAPPRRSTPPKPPKPSKPRSKASEPPPAVDVPAPAAPPPRPPLKPKPPLKPVPPPRESAPDRAAELAPPSRPVPPPSRQLAPRRPAGDPPPSKSPVAPALPGVSWEVTPPPAAVRAKPAAPAVPPAALEPLPAPTLLLRTVPEACAAELKLDPTPLRAARLHVEIAHAAEDDALALKHHRLALAKQPDHLPALHGARRLLLEKGDIKAAAKLYDAEIEISTSVERKAQLYWDKGRAWLDIAGERELAQQAFADAAQLDPNNLTVLKAHRHAQQLARQWAPLAEALAQEANASADDVSYRAALLVERAQLLERRLRNADEAIEELAGALLLDPKTPLALPEHKRLLFAQGRWQELVKALELEATLTDNGAVQTQTWWTTSRIRSERLGDRQEAILALEKAVAISPADALLLQELARLYQQQGDLLGCASALERLVQALPAAHDRVGVLQRLGELHDRPGGDHGLAAHFYEAALAEDAGFHPALAALDSLYHSMQNWPALAAMYTAEAAADLPSPQRAAAHARAAAIFDNRLADQDKATQHYRQALTLDPGHEGAFKALVRLYSAASRHADLIELYDRAVETAQSDDIAIAYLFKMGSLYEDVLADMRSAYDVFLRILARQPHQLGAIHALQRVAERAGLFGELVEALDREAALEKDRTRALAIQHQAAETLVDELGDHEAALPRLDAILKRDAKHAGALATLARVQRHLGRHADLLNVYERQLAIVSDSAGQLALLIEMARLCEQALGDDAKAVDWYRRAVELEPAHALARAGLVRLLRDRGDYKALAAALAAEVKAATEPAQLARSALLLGEVQEVHLNAADKAVTAYRRALDAQPGYRPALDALTRVHAALGEYKELAETLHLEADAGDDQRLAMEDLLRAAQIMADRLNKTEDALSLVEELAESDSTNVSALLLLEKLYVDGADAASLAGLFARQARVIKSPRARVAALVSQARLLAAKEHSADLRRVCLAILTIDRANDFALETLGRIGQQQGDLELAAKVHNRLSEVSSDLNVRAAELIQCGEALCQDNPAAALRAYREALILVPDSLRAIRGLARAGSMIGDASTMVESYQGEARWTANAMIAADLLVQSAAVLARLGEPSGAIDACRAALSKCPDHGAAAEMLAVLMARAGQIEALIGQLSQAAHAAERAPRKAALWRKVARLSADQQDDVGAAIAATKRALEAIPTDVETLLSLADLYVRDAQHDEAKAIYRKVVGLDDQALRAHLALGRIYCKHRPDAVKARASLQRVLKDEPDNREALALMLQLYLDAGDREAARAITEQLLDAAGDDAQTRAWALVEVGKLELKGGNNEGAEEALLGAVALEGLSGNAAKVYRRMLDSGRGGRPKQWEQYVRALRDYLANAVAPVTTLPPIFLEIAAVQHQQLEQPSDAFLSLQEGLARCKGDAQLRLARADMLVATGRRPEALSAYQSLAADRPDLAAAWRGYTTLLQEQGRPAQAVLAAGALAVLGQANDVERHLAHTARPVGALAGSMSRASLRAISAGRREDDDRIGELLGVLADPISKIFPPVYEQYGVRKGDRIKPRTGHGLRNQLDALAAMFGVEEVELYVHNQPGDVTLELSQPPALMVPGYFAELSEAQRTFLLARPLAAIASGSQAAYALPPAEVAVIVAAAVSRLVPHFEETQHDPERLALLQDKLAPSWFSRGKVDEAIQRYYPEAIDVISWAPSVQLTATRAAALLAGDLDACVEALRQVAAIPSNVTQDRLLAQPLVGDLLRFWMSEAAMQARTVAGLL